MDREHTRLDLLMVRPAQRQHVAVASWFSSSLAVVNAHNWVEAPFNPATNTTQLRDPIMEAQLSASWRSPFHINLDSRPGTKRPHNYIIL